MKIPFKNHLSVKFAFLSILISLMIPLVSCKEESKEIEQLDITLPSLNIVDMHRMDDLLSDQMISPQNDQMIATQDDQMMATQNDQMIATQDDQMMATQDQFVVTHQDQWQKRSCRFALQTFSPGYQSVQLAGEFTDWASRPISATPIGNGIFEVVFEANAGLIPNQMYAYKWIKDGQWQLDEDASLRKYDGNCVNSAFIYPDCQQPQIQEIRFEINQDHLLAEFKIFAPADHDISSLELTLDDVPISAELITENSSIRIDQSAISVGKHWLSIVVMGANGQSKSLKIPFWIENEPFIWQDQILYLLLIDRFANGDPSNDQPLRGPVYAEVDWHGGDLVGAKNVLESGYFDRLGVKAIWLSPVNAQTNGDFGDRALESRRIAAYHGYWPIKARMVEPRFGGDQALRDFIEAAHQRGIRVLLDLINNQVHQEHEYYLSNPDWFRTNCICGTNGCGWSEKPLECLFASYLPDINWRNPNAEKQFISDALYWVENFDVDGFRVDAVKHVESSAIFNLRKALDDHFGSDGNGGARIIMIGETAVGQNDQWQDGCGESFGNGYAWINGYIGNQALDGQFDFPTHHQIRWQLLSGNGQFTNVENALQMASSQYADQSLMVQFIGSHDTSRVISEADHQANFGCAWPSECQAVGTVQHIDVIQRLWRAWTILYTQPAMPLLYYGDEIGLAGSSDPDNRRDMLFDGVLSDLNPAFDSRMPTSLAVDQIKQRSFLETLGQIRQSAHALIEKANYRRWWIDADVWVYGFELNQKIIMIALNQSRQSRNLAFAIDYRPNLVNDLLLDFKSQFDQFLTGHATLEFQNQQISLSLGNESIGIWQIQ